MPKPIPNGEQFYIARRSLPASTEMPTLEIAPGFYQMGLLLSGDRYVITPKVNYRQHKRCLGTLAPYVYHRTFSASDEPYESYLLKFMPEFAADFTAVWGQHTLDRIFAHSNNYFSDEDYKRVVLLFEEMTAEYNSASPYRDFSLKLLLYRLFTIMLERRLPDSGEMEASTPLTPEIMNAIYYIGKHHKENPTLEEVAAYCGFSSAYFSRLFKKQLGKNYSEYLTMVRIRAVQELLIHTDKSITEITYELGYCHPSNLTSQFERVVGMSPLQYRRKS